jgi:hypothetical protein
VVEETPSTKDDAKKEKRRKRLQKVAEELERQQNEREKKRGEGEGDKKILTFRDMSHLSYFGGGGNNKI